MVRARPGSEEAEKDTNSRVFLAAAVVSFFAWLLHSYAAANLLISAERLAGKLLHH